MEHYLSGYLSFISNQIKEVFRSIFDIFYHTFRFIGDILHITILGENHFNQHLIGRIIKLVREDNSFISVVEYIMTSTEDGLWFEMDDTIKNEIVDKFNELKKPFIKSHQRRLDRFRKLDSIHVLNNGIS